MDNARNINEQKKASKASNIIALAVCFVIAFLVWFYVMQTESPEYQETFVRVPVAVENVSQLTSVSKLSVISGWDHSVSVTVKGRKSDIAKISEKDLRLYVDVSGFDRSGEQSVEVKAVIPGSLQLVSVSPAAVSIVVDEVITKEVPVSPNINQAKYDVDSELGEPKATPEFVEVTGPKSVVEQIESANVSLSLGDVTASVVAVAPFELVDAKGDKIENPYIRTNVQSVTVTIPLYTQKTVPVEVSYKYGYFNEENCKVSVSPSVVIIKGEHSLVSAVSSVRTAEVDEAVDGEAGEGSFRLIYPEGIECVNGVERVDITFEHINTKLAVIEGISSANITLTNLSTSGYAWPLYMWDTEIAVRGPVDVVDKLTADNIHIYATVDDLGVYYEYTTMLTAKIEGITITLPDGCEGIVYRVGSFGVYAKKTK